MIKDALERMDKSFNILVDQYRLIHLGNSGAFLDTIKVEYFGSMTPLPQMANIIAAYRGKYTIRPHDNDYIRSIAQAVQKANLGVSVSSDKTGVHVVVPSLSVEQKEKMAAHVTTLANDAKVAIRQIRQDVRKHEDEEKKTDKDLQKHTDEYIDKIDELCIKKSKVDHGMKPSDFEKLLIVTPMDWELRLVYADFLEDNDWPILAHGQRWQASHGKRPLDWQAWSIKAGLPAEVTDGDNYRWFREEAAPGWIDVESDLPARVFKYLIADKYQNARNNSRYAYCSYASFAQAEIDLAYAVWEMEYRITKNVIYNHKKKLWIARHDPTLIAHLLEE